MLSRKKKYLFIHCPKTAGSSMESVLDAPVYYRHQTLDFYYDYLKDDPVNLDEYFKFAFVRNPFTRIASGIINHPMRPGGNIKESFNKFILENEKQLTRFLVCKPQVDFVNHNGKVGVQFIGKFENLKEDWKNVARILGVSERLPHRVRGRKVDYNNLYTPETEAIIRRIYADDFELFGYE